MSLPDEKYRAVLRAINIAERMFNGDVPRGLKARRDLAYTVMRHAPTEAELAELFRIPDYLRCKRKELA